MNLTFLFVHLFCFKIKYKIFPVCYIFLRVFQREYLEMEKCVPNNETKIKEEYDSDAIEYENLIPIVNIKEENEGSTCLSSACKIQSDTDDESNTSFSGEGSSEDNETLPRPQCTIPNSHENRSSLRKIVSDNNKNEVIEYLSDKCSFRNVKKHAENEICQDQRNMDQKDMLFPNDKLENWHKIIFSRGDNDQNKPQNETVRQSTTHSNNIKDTGLIIKEDPEPNMKKILFWQDAKNVEKYNRYPYVRNVPAKCEECNQSFRRRIELKIHMREHLKNKVYECSICNKKFPRSNHLQNHLNSHTKDRPHKCEKCNRDFKTEKYLHAHYRTHERETVNSLICEVCGKVFTSPSHLTDHQLSHTKEKNHECDICGKTFRYKRGLNKHLAIHSGQKPFRCDLCNKTFNRKDNLNSHRRIHCKNNELLPPAVLI